MRKPVLASSIALASLLVLAGAHVATAQLAAAPQLEQKPQFLVATATTPVTVNVDRTPILQRRLSLSLHETPLKEALHEIAAQSELRLTYSDDVLPQDHRVQLRADGITLVAALTDVLLGTGLDVVFNPGSSSRAALVRRPSAPPAVAVGRIEGRVTGAESGAAISGATVRLVGTNLGSVTDAAGRYRINDVPAANYTITVEHIGYETAQRALAVRDGEITTADFALAIQVLPLDAVVATGTAFETRMRTVPNPISVITAEQIATRQASDLTSLLRGEIPGVMPMTQGHNDYRSFIYARGSQTLYFEADHMKVYIDGVEVADPSLVSTIDPKSIDRVEVVRGPGAAVIYGSEAASGVIQIFTKKGEHTGLDRPRLDVQASWGTTQSDYAPQGRDLPVNHDYSAQVVGGQEGFTYRAGGSLVRVGEWVTGYGSETKSLSAGLRAIHGSFTAELTSMWSHRDFQAANSPIYWRYPATDFCRSCGDPDFDPNLNLGLSQTTVGLTMRYQASENWRHTLVLGNDANRNATHQHTPTFLMESDTLLTLNNREIRRRSARYHTAYDTRPWESLTARFTVGAEYWNTDIAGINATNMRTSHGDRILAGPGATFQVFNNSWWNAGYFGTTELGFWDQLFLTLAVRVEDNPRFGDDFGYAVSPRAGFSWVRQFGDELEVKLRGQTGKGIRPPLEVARTGAVGPVIVTLPNPEIGPETKYGWDAGLELFWGQRGSFAVTRFVEDGRDLIMIVVLDASGFPRIQQQQNFGNAFSKGWEVEGRVDLGRVAFRANYAYTDNQVTKVVGEPGPNHTYHVGDRMMGIPTHSGGGTITARLLNGSVSLHTSMMDKWRALDREAHMDWQLGGAEHRGSTRAYIYESPFGPLWRFNLTADQRITERSGMFFRMDNITNNQTSDIDALWVNPGRATTMGIRYSF